MDFSEFEEVARDVEMFYEAGLSRNYVGFVISRTTKADSEIAEDLWLLYDLEREEIGEQDGLVESVDLEEIYEEFYSQNDFIHRFTDKIGNMYLEIT